MTQLDRDQVLAYRYFVNGLVSRLPPGSLVDAAHAGLQDSAPRSGVLSLHARVEEVDQSDWSDRRLTQVWGPRGAVYLIPKADLGAFTLGLLPRDPARIEQLSRQAKQVLRTLDGRPRRPEAILDAAGINGIRELLWTAATGWFLPIWDASTTAVYPAEPADADPEECRLELARRFLHHLGPSTKQGLQWWTGATGEDAGVTMTALAQELATVEVGGEEAVMLSTDVETALTAPAPEGMHLLPPDDVYINRLCGPLLLNDHGAAQLLYPKAPNPGAVVVDGRVLATWRRRARQFTVEPLPGRDLAARVAAIEEAATGMPLPGDPGETVVVIAPGG